MPPALGSAVPACAARRVPPGARLFTSPITSDLTVWVPTTSGFPLVFFIMQVLQSGTPRPASPSVPAHHPMFTIAGAETVDGNAEAGYCIGWRHRLAFGGCGHQRHDGNGIIALFHCML